MTDKGEEYLWDRSGEPDPTTEKLEELLGRFAHRPDQVPDLAPEFPEASAPAPTPMFPPSVWQKVMPVVLAAAAALVLLLTIITRDGSGSYMVSGIDGVELVRVGESVSTKDGQLATIQIGEIGDVRLDPESRLAVERIQKDEHFLALEKGSMYATILAPARVFQVDTPAGRAVDLGCEYSLRVTDGGDSYLSVVTGAVSFELDGRAIYVPAGASCVSLMEGGPGVPVFDSARDEFKKLIEAVQFRKDPELGLIKKLCEMTDDREYALSLVHLLFDGTPEVRKVIFGRLSSMFPLPDGVTDQDIVGGDRDAIESWMELMKPYWLTASSSKFLKGGKRSKLDLKELSKEE